MLPQKSQHAHIYKEQNKSTRTRTVLEGSSAWTAATLKVRQEHMCLCWGHLSGGSGKVRD